MQLTFSVDLIQSEWIHFNNYFVAGYFHEDFLRFVCFDSYQTEFCLFSKHLGFWRFLVVFVDRHVDGQITLC